MRVHNWPQRFHPVRDRRHLPIHSCSKELWGKDSLPTGRVGRVAATDLGILPWAVRVALVGPEEAAPGKGSASKAVARLRAGSRAVAVAREEAADCFAKR